MFSLFRCLCAVVVVPLMLVRPVQADTITLSLPDGYKTSFALQTGLLELALQYAPGDHSLEVISMRGLSQKRMFSMLDDGLVNVMLAGYSRDAEADLLQIDYPLTNGLQGYRLLITHKDTFEALDHVASRDDLKRVCIGSGNSWVDTRILEHAGLCVVGGPGRNLYAMLEKRRFDVMHLAIHELATKSTMDMLRQHNLMVYESLLLRYPYDFYFYVRKDSKSLHDLIEQGFHAATQDGAISRYFQRHPGVAYAIRFLQEHPGLRVIDLDNPEMSDQNIADIYRYWLQH